MTEQNAIVGYEVACVGEHRRDAWLVDGRSVTRTRPFDNSQVEEIVERVG